MVRFWFLELLFYFQSLKFRWNDARLSQSRFVLDIMAHERSTVFESTTSV